MDEFLKMAVTLAQRPALTPPHRWLDAWQDRGTLAFDARTPMSDPPAAHVIDDLSRLSVTAEVAELSGVKVEGPLTFPSPGAAGSWKLGPLAAANGTLRSKIVDAQLLFDADVTVPIAQGEIDFGDASVENVGPDSRLGVSPQGVYVDAANGRTYLYEFRSTAIPGVEFERRGTLLGPWVSDRGSLQLEGFVEALLSPAGGQAPGLTEQARRLLGRTSLQGEVRLGDGPLAGQGLQAELAGSAQGRNVVRVQSDAVSRGLRVEIDSLFARDAEFGVGPMQLHCDEVSGALTLRVVIEDAAVRFALELVKVKISGLRAAQPP